MAASMEERGAPWGDGDGERGKVRSGDLELTTNSPNGDPSTMKRFGYIAAQPSEFLIVYRNGKLRTKASGQGARCFKWPWDTVAIIPTTLKEVIFQANQITADNVDVKLRGSVVYRISDPRRIYKLINFSYRQRGEGKLARMIADMCRSIAKWLVANMGVEDCVRRRKEEIALALKSEVSAVVSADCPEGWGVDIISIDIQDIFIQDSELFQALQATFKTEKQREAELAQLQTRVDVERRSIETENVLAQDRHRQAVEQAKLAGQRQLAEVEFRRRKEEEDYKLANYRIEQDEKLALYKIQQEENRNRIAGEASRDRAAIRLESQRQAAEEEVRALRERQEIEDSASPASLERLYITEALPRVANAMAASLKNARFSVYQSAGTDNAGSSPLHYALNQVLDVLQERRTVMDG